MNGAKKQFLIEFIRLYKSFPALWKVKHKEYRDEAKKEKYYGALTRKLAEKYPSTTKDLVKRNIQNLHISYYRELRKQKAFEKTNKGGFESKLWYYDLLSFLEGQVNEKYESDESSADEEGEEEEEDVIKTESCSSQKETASSFEEEHLIQLSCDKIGTSFVKVQPEENDPFGESSSNSQAQPGKREELLEFIDLYKSLPSLWEVKNKEYQNRRAKDRDYNILVEKLRETDPYATRESATKKINSIRTSYRRELKKIKASHESGEEYTPLLWYFELLSFLEDQVEEIKTVKEKRKLKIEEQKEQEPETKKSKISLEDKLIKLACDKLEKGPQLSDPLAQTWSSQFNGLQSQQQLIARKLITDILFQASLGNLRIEHTIEIQNIFTDAIVTNYRLE